MKSREAKRLALETAVLITSKDNLNPGLSLVANARAIESYLLEDKPSAKSSRSWPRWLLGGATA